MIFSDSFFIFIFFPVFFAFYLTFTKKREYVLFFFSSIFCIAYSLKIFLLFFFPFIVMNYILYRLNFWLLLKIVFNLSVLVFFKYSGIFDDSFDSIKMEWFNEIVFPLGISFVIFQLISFYVDESQEDKNDKKINFLKFYNYFTFFPQLIAGPICRKDKLLPQISSVTKLNISADDFFWGLVIFSTGVLKKVILADNIGIFIDNYFDAPVASTLNPIVCVIAYTLQLYFDFSGYSDMAVGLGRMMGVKLPENFLDPFKSKSFLEFWKRWHVTLNTFFYDYIYLPLVFSWLRFLSFTKLKVLVGVIVVFFLSGAWHGTGYNYVLFGLYHAFWILMEALFIKKKTEKGFFARVIVFLICIIGFTIFRTNNLEDLSYVIFSVFDIHNYFKIELNETNIILSLLVIYKLCCPDSRWYLDKIKEICDRSPRVRKYTFCIITALIPAFFMLSHYISNNNLKKFIYFAF